MREDTLGSEPITLFNPAFCAVLLNKAAGAYEKKSKCALSLTYAFLILPSALHLTTRRKLPSKTSASMWSWVRSHPDIVLDFADRARSLRPFTADAIKFGLQYGALIYTRGSLSSGTLKRRPRNFQATNDWQDCVNAAEFLGRWFGLSKVDEPTMLTLWGVRL